MRSYKGLVNRYIINEKRSVVPIFISIILTIGLITSVVFITQNMIKNTLEKKKAVYGDYDIRLQKINTERLDKINAHDNVKDYALGKNNEILVNSIKQDDGSIQYMMYSNAYAVEKKFFDDYINFKVIEGRLPEKENEIVLNKSMLQSLNYEGGYGVGTSIEFNIREILDGYNYTNAINEIYFSLEGDEYGDWNEIDRRINEFAKKNGKIEEDVKKVYTVVGIIETDTLDSLFGDKIIRLLTEEEISDKSNEFEAFTYLNDKSKEEKLADELGLTYIIPTSNMKDPFGYPTADVKYPGYKKASYTSIMRNGQARNIIAIIILFCFMAVYNTFHASVAKRIKVYGILRALGGSKEQISYLIYTEALILYSIAAPIGLIFGYVLTKVESYILINKMGLLDNFIINFNLEVILIILISALFITVISVRSILKKENRLTPIEAIMNARGLGNKKKSLGKNLVGQNLSESGNGKEDVDAIKEVINYEKTTLKYKIVNKLFKYEGELAHKNITRDVSAHNLTRRTLFIAMAILIFFFLQVVNGKVNSSSIIKSDKWDVKLSLNTNDFDNSVVNTIKEVNGVEDVYKFTKENISLVVPNEIISDELKAVRASLNLDSVNGETYNTKNTQGITGSMITVDENSIKFYEGLDKELLDNGGVAIVNKATNFIQQISGQGVVVYVYQNSNPVLTYNDSHKLLISEDISVLTEAGLDKYYADNRTFTELKVVGTVDDDILNSTYMSTNVKELDVNVKFLTTEEGLKKITSGNSNKSILIRTNSNVDRADVIAELEKISANNNYELEDIIGNKLEAERNNKESLGLNIIFSISILIMVVLNLINTTNASIISRRKELAGMRAIGMSKAQQRKMIIGELFYLSLSVAFTVILSIGIISVASQGANIGAGKVKVGTILFGEGVIIIFLMIISNLTSLAPLSKVNKFSIVEDLKED